MDWSDMLEEVLDLIQSKLFGNDRDTFGLVCRNWNKVVSTQSPYLVFPTKGSHIWKVFTHNTSFFLDFPKLDKNVVIRCSKHGWLLISWGLSKLLFFHPFDNLKIEVPDCLDPNPDDYGTISFFNPPTSPDCFLIGIHRQASFVEADQIKHGVEIGLLKHGEDKWKTYKFTIPIEFMPSLAQPILHDGKLYFLDNIGNIATIDMIDEPIVESAYVHRKCLKHQRLRMDIVEHFMVKPYREDTIFAVFSTLDPTRNIQVFKLSKDIVWEPVDDLGDRVFYVSNSLSFGYTTHNKSMANKIFFPKFHGDKIVLYSLNTRKYHSFEGDYSRKNCFGFSRFQHAAWMMHELTPPERLLTWCSQEDLPVS